MGIFLDEQRNRDARGFDEMCRISTEDSPIAVLVVPTDEERMIARESSASAEPFLHLARPGNAAP